jgi:uncharacterized protein (UPF0332 family)
MSLQNLLKIGALAEHVTDAEQVNRMLASVGRSIEDSRQESISLETRFDAAYRAVMQVSMAALWANGFRPSKSAPGHHRTMIQSLIHSVGLDNDRMLVLDTFRVKRNAIDYTGEDVDVTSVESCIEAAEHLLQHLNQWLSENRPDLVR